MLVPEVLQLIRAAGAPWTACRNVVDRGAGRSRRTRLEPALADDGAGDADRDRALPWLGARGLAGRLRKGILDLWQANLESRGASRGIEVMIVAGHEAFIDELIGTFTPRRFRARPSASTAEPDLLHLRHSGFRPEIARNRLAAHPRVTSGTRHPAAPGSHRQLMRCFPAAADADAAATASAHVTSMMRRLPGGGPGHHNARTISSARVAKALFPRARIVQAPKRASAPDHLSRSS